MFPIAVFSTKKRRR